MIPEEKLRRIVELERKHTQLYHSLLESLDELYMVKAQGDGEPSGEIKLDQNQRHMLEIRRNLQMSMEKSATILKTLDRLNKIKKNEDVVNVEDMIAVRIKELMEDNFQIDSKITKLLSEQNKLLESLRTEKTKYRNLVERLQTVHPKHNRVTVENSSDSDTDADLDEERQLELENETIAELLVALKVYSGV
ncbi:hypothetical protein KAFR_0B00690 [Kazachstania africana CBS 2517]|uniref:Uncharacterized protein n=1 Tax=Kazachstania africana (strain ATCC 22294 / BCRC 22015 / CBS 2517 / CECT 1963 / NBRC 1671 / NRRL Y-8276) TaxID=1071382 RepID=H2APR8_KAZAF|nr:hypothetical protein KAFR_0B00690 [Kazachstania africana CBS 2517]CCF56368.1 hypothetical protein KAFR_0B00690 [Kazachstania africana CBS 2517]